MSELLHQLDPEAAFWALLCAGGVVGLLMVMIQESR